MQLSLQKFLVFAVCFFILFAPTLCSASSRGDAELNRIVIKFEDDTGIEIFGNQLYALGNSRGLTPQGGQKANLLSNSLIDVGQMADDNALPVKKLFKNAKNAPPPIPYALDTFEARPHGDLASYVSLELPSHWTWDQAQVLADQIREMEGVETSYVEAKPVIASWNQDGPDNSNTPDFSFTQDYHNPAPQGIDAFYAWDVPGGRGSNVSIIDIEYSMFTTHEDLPALFIAIGTDENHRFEDHGTAVMGVLGAVDNGFGMTGISHDAQFGFISQSTTSIANAIRQAADEVGPGGVILLELQMFSAVDTTCACGAFSCSQYIPAEFYQAEYDAIRYATSQEVTVVQAAGNGSVNLDDLAYVDAYNLLGREDSGSIMVGASSSFRREPKCFSNHGSYVDLHGWGENVATTGYGNWHNGGSDDGFTRSYTHTFSGTSSATPIVAGAVANLQSVAIEATGTFLSPSQIKERLQDTGTPQNLDMDRPIGPLPNLKSAIKDFFGDAPQTDYQDVYFRGSQNDFAPLAMTAVFDHVWEIEVTFGNSPDPRFKFDMFGDWSENYGDTDGNGVAELAGSDIQLSANSVYKIRFHEIAKRYWITKLSNVDNDSWQRTVIFIYGETEDGQDMFIRGGVDHDHANTFLGKNCASDNFECAIPIRHNNLLNATTAPWKSGDEFLDWYGTEVSQNTASVGTPLDWTIDLWPSDWGTVRRVEQDGFGETPLNHWGAHYWMLDVDMDCSATVDGWFELKSFISNGPGWESDVNQSNTPWISGNHFAECGKLNVFQRGVSQPLTIEAL